MLTTSLAMTKLFFVFIHMCKEFLEDRKISAENLFHTNMKNYLSGTDDYNSLHLRKHFCIFVQSILILT